MKTKWRPVKPIKPTRKSRCRDCALTMEVRSIEFSRKASPRCPACGGILDSISPRFYRRTPRGRHHR